MQNFLKDACLMVSFLHFSYHGDAIGSYLCELSSYRIVSVLKIMGKILERVMCIQKIALPDLEYRFRQSQVNH